VSFGHIIDTHNITPVPHSHFNPFRIASHTHPHTHSHNCRCVLVWQWDKATASGNQNWAELDLASVSLGGQRRYHPVPSATPSGMQKKTALIGCL